MAAAHSSAGPDCTHKSIHYSPETLCVHLQADLDTGCECAGRLWRCADKKDPITKACDVGLQCVRKNKFYAICADAERAAIVQSTGEWDMTPLPCLVNVAEYKPELLLPSPDKGDQ